MKLMECLDLCNETQIVTVARNLGVFVEKVHISYLKRKIEAVLINHELMKKRVLNKLDGESTNALKQLVYGDKTLYKSHCKVLGDYGLLYSEALPDEIRIILNEYLAPTIRKQFPQKPQAICPSAFLKLILLIGLIQREKMNVCLEQRKKKKTIKALAAKLFLAEGDYNFIELALEYLIYKNLANQDKDNVVLNNGFIIKWYEEPGLKRIQDFYAWLFHSLHITQILLLIKRLGLIQKTPEDWIEYDLFCGLIPVYVSKEKIKSFGLIRFIEEDDKHYIQLTPEGWFLAKEECPPSWNQSGIIVSADFEVFIEHTYDPLITAVIDCFGKLTAIDYFIVYNKLDKCETSNKWCDYNTFCSVLSSRSRRLPDVVKYEMKRLCN